MHRLWEPLAEKQTPHNGYAGKFSTPYCIAAGFVRGNVGFEHFTDAAVQRPGRARARREGPLPRSIPNNPYPHNFTGHIRATLRDGSVVEERQPHLRGGAHEPLTRRDIEDKFRSTRVTAAGSDAAQAGSGAGRLRRIALFAGRSRSVRLRE